MNVFCMQEGHELGGEGNNAMVWIFVFPQNLYIEILMPYVMISGGGAFEKWLGHDGSILMKEIMPL